MYRIISSIFGRKQKTDTKFEAYNGPSDKTGFSYQNKWFGAATRQ